MFSVYRQLRSREILQKPMMVVRGVKCTPYIIGDATYPIQQYLQKISKTHNEVDVDK